MDVMDATRQTVKNSGREDRGGRRRYLCVVGVMRELLFHRREQNGGGLDKKALGEGEIQERRWKGKGGQPAST